jgi:predicted Zn finger-like uncharacterized protein
LTLFRVGPEHLKAAAGQVRCCQCHQVFNALHNLQDSPTSFSNHDIDTKAHETAEQLPETNTKSALAPGMESLPELTETSDWQDIMEKPPLSGAFDSTQPDLAACESQDQFIGDILEQDEGLESEPDYEELVYEEPVYEKSDYEQPPSSGAFDSTQPDLAACESEDRFISDILEQDDGLESEPDYFTSDSESQMSELLDQDSSSLLQPASEEPSTEPPAGPGSIVATAPAIEYAAVEVPTQEPQQPEEERGFEDIILKEEAIDQESGRPDYKTAAAFHADTEIPPKSITDDDRALNFEVDQVTKPRYKFNLYWLIGSLLLLLPLAGQIAWQLRDDLIHSEGGRQTLNLICLVAGCEVPTRRALDQIIIEGRNLSSHPSKPDMLSLQLSIVNTAAFDQPFPLLGLSFYNDTGNLIARRTFTASEYLPQRYKNESMMPQAQSILVEMELVDPGKEVTGFSFDFY